MSMKELQGTVTRDNNRKESLTAPKPGKEAWEYMQQTCIHGVTGQTFFACADGNIEKRKAKGGTQHGL
jgi:hypothetical protein